MDTQKALKRFVGVVSLCIALTGSLALAGGPKDLTTSGVPVRWNPAQVGYVIDNGPLGPNSRDQAAGIVRSAFKAWEDVPSSTITFNDLGFLNVDVNVNNYNQYINSKRPEGNVIIFDNDGSITNDLLGQGSEDVLGFASAIPVSPTSSNYDFAFAVLNGPSSSDPGFLGVMIHEFGHLIGFDHTQAGLEQATDGDYRRQYQHPDHVSRTVTRLRRTTPRPDDIAWISWLYPTSDFATTTGTIKGQVFFPPGTPLPGANVVAVQVTTGANSSFTESNRQFVSVVSDFLVKGDGSFEIPGLAPGNYVVFIEPLLPEFKAGSSVGPFDTRFENFVKDYYNGAAESDQDNPDEAGRDSRRRRPDGYSDQPDSERDYQPPGLAVRR